MVRNQGLLLEVHFQLIKIKIMNIIIELNKNINRITEIYESLDLVAIFSNVCAVIDENNLATFGIYLENGEKISPKMDFKYDFTSVLPELYEMLNFLKQGNSCFYKVYLYEINKTIRLDTFSEEYVSFSLYSDDMKISEYKILKQDLIFNIEINILKFKNLVRIIFPIAYTLFVKENYLEFGDQEQPPT